MGCIYSKYPEHGSFNDKIKYRSYRSYIYTTVSSLFNVSRTEISGVEQIFKLNLITRNHLYYHNVNGDNFLHYLCESNRMEAIESLDPKYNEDIKKLLFSNNASNYTPFFISCLSGTVQTFIKVLSFLTISDIVFDRRLFNVLTKSFFATDKTILLIEKFTDEDKEINIDFAGFILLSDNDFSTVIDRYSEKFCCLMKKSIMSKQLDFLTMWERLYSKKNKVSQMILYNDCIPDSVANKYFEDILITHDNGVEKLFRSNSNMNLTKLLDRSSAEPDIPILFRVIKNRNYNLLDYIFTNLSHEQLQDFLNVTDRYGNNLLMYSVVNNIDVALKLFTYFGSGLINKDFLFRKNNEMIDFVHLAPRFAVMFLEQDKDRVMAKFCSQENLSVSEIISLKYWANSLDYKTDSEEECDICYNERKTVVFNCKHLVGFNCGMELKKCPFCNAHITERSFF